MTLIYDKYLPAAPHAQSTWVRPVNLILGHDPACGESHHRLAGGWAYFDKVDVVMHNGTHYVACRMAVSDWLAAADGQHKAEERLAYLTDSREMFAGLSMAEPQIMGIVNVTPDSFSDGGVHYQTDDGIEGALAMADAGARILDIGGESTRPGAAAVPADEEIARITPVISALTEKGHIISADTRHTAVMGAALRAGAPIINDVGGFRDTGAPEMVAEAYALNPQQGYAIAMHMQGTPQTMQANPHYEFAPIDVYNWLEERINTLEAAGLPRSHIAIDPGFGFGKTPEHNLQIIRWTSLFHGLGVPLLIGVSRKSTIAKLSNNEEASARLGGSLALTLEAISAGAQMIRTHDVAQTKQAITIHLATGL